MSVKPLRFLLLVFAGWVNRRRVEVIEYLHEENRVLPRAARRPSFAFHRRAAQQARREGQSRRPTRAGTSSPAW